MDHDFAARHPQRGQVVGQSARHRQQASGRLCRAVNLCGGALGLTPKMDIRAACLDRTGQAERLRNPHYGRTIGVEELRIDQIERCPCVELAGERQHGARFRRRVEPPANPRDQRKARTQDLHPAAHFARRRTALPGIARVERQREGRQPDRVDHDQIDIAAHGHRLHLPLDKHAEIGVLVTRVQRGQRQDAQPLHRLRTSISATAIQAGCSTTTWREPAPGASTATRRSSRLIIRPNANRPPGRGTSTSRLSRRG